MRLKALLHLLVVLATAPVDGLKFLLYNPTSSKSHVGFQNKIGAALLDAGHDVVSAR